MAKDVPEALTAPAEVQALEEAMRLVDGRKRRMQLTKGARFEASRRHKFSGRSASYSIVFLSVWIFGLSVYVLIYPNSPGNNYLNAVNLILSFFVIAFSLLQSAKRHELRSEMFLKCAQEIDEISTDLGLRERQSKARFIIESHRNPVDVGELGKLSNEIFEYVKEFDKRYQKVLMAFSDNHSDIDYNIYISSRVSEIPREVAGGSGESS